MQEVGGLVGRFILAVPGRHHRQPPDARSALFQVPGLIVVPRHVRPGWRSTEPATGLYTSAIFLAGLVTVAQFSFWGNYLPRVYPLHLRGTGESFAANIGGRMIGTSFAWVTATLAVTTDRAYAPTKVAMVAAVVGISVYLVGFIASFWLPEPKSQDLAE